MEDSYLLTLQVCLEMVIHGVAFHHAGMELADRRTVEEIFSEGSLPVLRKSDLLIKTRMLGVEQSRFVIYSCYKYTGNGGKCTLQSHNVKAGVSLSLSFFSR